MGKIKHGQYWDVSWNPLKVKGGGFHCTKCSPGCLHCWAETLNIRFYNGKPYDNRKVEYVLDAKVLGQPMRRRIPTTYFVCDLCDLFHEAVPITHFWPDKPLGFIDKVMCEVIGWCPEHTFLILTKRPQGALEYFRKFYAGLKEFHKGQEVKPLPQLHLGVSVSTQDEDWKIAELLKIQAAFRWLSIEPILGKIDILSYPKIDNYQATAFSHYGSPDWYKPKYDGLNWVVIGAESIGGNAGRECKLEWVRDVVRQCDAASVPIHIKQIHLWQVKGVSKLFETANQAKLHCGECKVKRVLIKDVTKFPKDLRRQEYLKPIENKSKENKLTKEEWDGSPSDLTRRYTAQWGLPKGF